MEPRTVGAGHGWTWIVQGFALFRRSPAVWVALLLVLYLATKLLAVIPLLGVIFALLLPVFIVGLMEGCRALEHGSSLQPGHLLSGFRHNAAQIVTIGGVFLVGNLVVMMVVLGLGGDAMATVVKAMAAKTQLTPQAVEELRGPARTVGQAMLAGMLVSLPLLMAVWYAPLLVYFHDQGPIAAMKSSFMACVKNAVPMLVYGLAIIVGMFIAMPFGMALGQYDLALWLLAPVLVPSLYTSYKDIFLAGTAPQTGTDSVAG